MQPPRTPREIVENVKLRIAETTIPFPRACSFLPPLLLHSFPARSLPRERVRKVGGVVESLGGLYIICK